MMLKAISTLPKRTETGTWINSNMFIATLANLDNCMSSLNFLGKAEDYGNEQWGEDLFAQRCMDLNGVDRVSAWDITTDGMYESYRPEGMKKNKQWKPDCSVTMTAALHPFKKPKETGAKISKPRNQVMSTIRACKFCSPGDGLGLWTAMVL